MSFKVTKYPQSCLLIEKDDKRIIIDPGSFVAKDYSAKDLLPVDAILITHEHPDHAHPELIKALIGDTNIPVIANASTKDLLGDLVTMVVLDEEEFEVAGFHAVARELAHMLMVDGSNGPQNTGYVLDGVFFHPGDGKDIDLLQVDVAAVIIAGPDASYKDAYDFAIQLGCKKIIPIHNDIAGINPTLFKGFLDATTQAPFEIIALQNGESVEL